MVYAVCAVNSIKIKHWDEIVMKRFFFCIQSHQTSIFFPPKCICISLCVVYTVILILLNIFFHFFSLTFSFHQLFQAHVIYYHEYKSWKMQINTLDNRFEYIPLNPHRKQCQKYRAYGVELSGFSFYFFFSRFASLTVYIKLVFILY